MYGNVICMYLGGINCKYPWSVERNLSQLYICPTPFGDQNKAYCCYDIKGEVKCCDHNDFFIYGFVQTECDRYHSH